VDAVVNFIIITKFQASVSSGVPTCGVFISGDVAMTSYEFTSFKPETNKFGVTQLATNQAK
jgi:hypothetical protein